MKFIWTLLLVSITCFAQKNTQLSNQSEISILTCAPGQNELYSQFGHTAIRVKDKTKNIDYVYNYGTFDFNTPNFYLKFCRGQLLYQVSRYPYKYFPYVYYKENRWVQGQILNITLEEKQKVFNYLEWNILPENKKYRYDFFFDNCATKAPEIIEKSLGNIDYNFSKFPKDFTYRNLIHAYLDNNNWSKFGIDLALGSVIDQKAPMKDYLFLPDYVLLALENASYNGKKLIQEKKYILPDYKLPVKDLNFFLSPLFVCLLFLVFAILSVLKNSVEATYTLTLIIGLLGLVIFSLWFLTEHSTTKNNFNLLWANPFLLILPFVKHKWKKLIAIKGLLFLFAFAVVALLKIQEFNLGFYILSLSVLLVYLKVIKDNYKKLSIAKS